MGDTARAGPARRPIPQHPLRAVAGCRSLALLLLAGWALGLPQPARVHAGLSPRLPLAELRSGWIPAPWPGPVLSIRSSLLAVRAADERLPAVVPSAPAEPPGLARPAVVAPAASPAGNGVRPLQPAPASDSDDPRQVRERSLAAVRADPDAWIRRYLLRVTSRCTPQGVVIRAGTADLAEAQRRGPLLISADEAKELFPAFARDKRSRSRHSGSVHEASLLITDLLWRRAMARPLRPQRNLVLFSGGGVASGKTYALTHSDAARGLMPRTEIVQDSTMSDRRRAQARIDQALARGRSVQVIYVFTPIEQAVRWLVERGMRAGRAVAAAAVARSHWQSQATVLALADHYRGRPAVRFGLLVNGPGASGELRPIEALRPLRAAADPRFPDLDSFRRHVDTLVRQELRRRHLDADPANPTPELEGSLHSGIAVGRERYLQRARVPGGEEAERSGSLQL